MSTHKFTGKNYSEVFRKVQQQLGEEAIILKSTDTAEGVEVVATLDEFPSENLPAIAKGEASSKKRFSFSKNRLTNSNNDEEQENIQEVKIELKSIRDLIQDQLSGLIWTNYSRSNPAYAGVLRRLCDIGVSPLLAEAIVSRINSQADTKQAWMESLTYLQQAIPIYEEPAKLSRIIVVVGATGHGVTTTIAKIAAHSILHKKAKSVAIISTDVNRVAASNLSKRYSEVLNVDFYEAADSSSLNKMIYMNNEKDLILIDTPSISHTEGNAEVENLIKNIKHSYEVFLTISAASQRLLIEEIIKKSSSLRLNACIFSMCDLATSLGGAISSAIQFDLPIAFIAKGSNIAKDLIYSPSGDLVKQAQELAEKYYDTVTEEKLANFHSQLVIK